MKRIHLDFHTSPDIEGIGEHFNKAEFTATVRAAGIDSMTVFAKCHHGYCYYPTRVGKMHPHLKFNLLKEQIDAIHDAGAKAPIYITFGWSKLDADEHPEWHHIDFHTGKPRFMGEEVKEGCDDPLCHCSWASLCPVGSYLYEVERVTRDLCEQFDVSDGIFYDICFMGDNCVCPDCVKGMRERGLDPTSLADAKQYYSDRHMEMMQYLTAVVHEYSPDAPVFYNGGADMNRTEYHPYQTHYELEDLPTAWGGYDLMPLRAKFFERYGKTYLGMTGKFHHAWGEFGGFKHPEALRYECADMLSVGAKISVGDHLHPSGKLDESTYRLIGHAFHYADRIIPYAKDTRAYTDIALFMSHSEDSDIGASKLLQLMHLDFDVIESAAEIKDHRLVILPDCVRLSDDDKARLTDFVARGGKIVASYECGFEGIGVKKIAPSTADLDYIGCEVAGFNTPFLSYSSAYITECEGEPMARVYEPYFNRTHSHFCGHKNTPYRLDAAEYPALVKNGGVIYFAHPVFAAYNKSGNYVLEEYIKQGILSVYTPYAVAENLPSAAKLRTRVGDGFIAMHLLYAPPINRGNVCLLPDFPTLHGVKIRLKTDRAVGRVHLPTSGVELAFEQRDGVVCIDLPPFSLHELVVIE